LFHFLLGSFDLKIKSTVDEVLSRIPGPVTPEWPMGERFAIALAHGSMSVEYYAPVDSDPQTPHDQDEVYFIHKGTGELAAESYEDLVYEVYGPGGTAVVVEVLTDNRNRTAGEIRKLLERTHGKLAASGSVLYLFHKKGHILFEKAVGEDKLMEAALDAGADDVRADGEGFLVETEAGKMFEVKEKLEKLGMKSVHAEVGMYPETSVKLEGDDAAAMWKLVQALEDHDDVQNVYANYEIDDALMEQLSA